jgi:hypothetical protein
MTHNCSRSRGAAAAALNIKAVLRATLFSLGCYLLAMASQMQVDLVKAELQQCCASGVLIGPPSSYYGPPSSYYGLKPLACWQQQ